ncbi:MAG: hypothetical protein R3263_12340 [Myxococcota bacterium]|nr:hypothetical protein [Myxococcota bacterium]
MEALETDPAREDLRARLEVDGSLLDRAQREVEVRNWLDGVVRPRAGGGRPLRPPGRGGVRAP